MVTLSPSDLLTDEQVRSFIVNGLIVIKPNLDKSIHDTIHSELTYACQNETWHGNNLASRIPLFHQVLRSPKIDGALISLAGHNYYLHPHRALHRSTPVEEILQNLEPETDGPKMGANSTAGSGWHQDAQSPLARARHHLPKYLIGFYFPHDTPRAMGPTRLIPGSQLDSSPNNIKDVFFPEFVEAGTFMIVHFDMVHAGYPNQTALDRHMVKFVFTRTEAPASPTWHCQDTAWKIPKNSLVSEDLTPAWLYTWNWLLGEHRPRNKDSHLFETSEEAAASASSNRIINIYSKKHSKSTKTITNRLLEKKGLEKHQRTLVINKDRKPLPIDDISGYPIRWNERAIVMEDEAYQLAAAGQDAIEPLTRLLSSLDPWLQINAAFALGEINDYPKETLFLLISLLDSPHQQVVRQALDALAFNTAQFDKASWEAVEHIIKKEKPEWQTHLVQRGWTGQDQIRLNAAFLLLNAATSSNPSPEIEDLMIHLLGDTNGYAAAVVSEGLIRLGSSISTAAAIEYLTDRRWDESIRGTGKAF